MRTEGMYGEEAESLDAPRLPPFLRDPVGMLRRRWTWMLVALLLGLVTTALVVVQLEPRYAASATVRITSQQISSDFIPPMVTEDSFQRIDAMLADILSRETLSGLIETHDLYPELREKVLLSELAGRMREDIDVRTETGSAPRSRRQAAASLLVISFEADTPDAAAAVTNDLARLFIDASIESRTARSSSTTGFLKDELKKADDALRKKSQEITDFKERHRGELPDDLTANLSKLDRLTQQRQSLQLRIAEAESHRVTVSSEAYSDRDYADPQARLVALRARLTAQRSVYTETHPDIAALKREIEALEEEIRFAELTEPEGSAAASSPQTSSDKTLRALRAQLAETEEAIRTRDARVARTPARQAELAALEEQAGVLRETYLEFLRKVDDAELAMDLDQAQQGERFQVVSSAVPPTAPTRPRWLVLAGGLAASLGLFVAVGLLLEILDPVVLAPDQLEAAAHLPVLGSAPMIT